LSSKSVSGKFTACDWAVPQAAATAVNLYGIVYEVAALVSFVTGPDSSYTGLYSVPDDHDVPYDAEPVGLAPDDAPSVER
jgi:hypothetical protein